MKNVLLDIKHDINRNLGNIIENLSWCLCSFSKRSRFGYYLYAMYNMLLRCISFASFEVVSHRVYVNTHETSLILPIFTNRVGYTSKMTYGLEPWERDLIPVSMEDVYLAKHKNVRIQGNSDFILNIKERLVINDFCYNMRDNYVMFDGILLRLKNNVAVLRNKGGNQKCRHLKSGIMMSGKFSRNYYHEMYEILIRLLVLDKVDIPSDVPLVIDEIVLKIDSFKKIFEALNVTKREIIVIEEKEIIEFNNLYYISAINFISPHYKDISDPNHLYDFVFDCNLISLLRNKLLSFKSSIETPKRIFITRKNSKIRHYNETEIFDVLKKYGFEIVAPEIYNLYDQIALFNNASYIVGGSGAAFTNLLFCNAECNVICFRATRNNSSIFSTIANCTGVKMRYLIGDSTNQKDMHADYTINVDELKRMIDYNED